MSPEFEAGVRAAVKVIEDHGWDGVANTVRRETGIHGHSPMDPGELRIWRR